MQPPKPSAYYAAQLRHELNGRNYTWAKESRTLHALTYGSAPSVIYSPDERGRHGNFYGPSYRAIVARPDWARRLDKVLSQARSALPQSERRWRELDSAHSSDALLMSVFCSPGLLEDPRILGLLSVDSGTAPAFGVRAGVPLTNGRTDRTEWDMELGDLLVEAKLTESNFQRARRTLVTRYRDLETVFDIASLPQQEETVFEYQLIRGALAAHARSGAFAVFCDARRPDLVEAWYSVMQAVRLFDLRHRLKLLTWQELACVLPDPLQRFLEAKYGIVSAG